MKKILIIIGIIAIALISFNTYTNSGEVLNEKLELKEIIPSEPSIIEEDQAFIDEMTSKAHTMTKEEKMEAEEKMVKMMNKEETIIQKNIPAPPPNPAKIGYFTEIDLIHKGSGRALIYPTAKGGPTVQLNNFAVTRGPDLYVYLSKNTAIKEKGLGEFTNLGKLKSSKGNQNYLLPADWNEYHSVVIWCKAFGVLFSEAALN
jgi:hypothetical protein